MRDSSRGCLTVNGVTASAAHRSTLRTMLPSLTLGRRRRLRRDAYTYQFATPAARLLSFETLTRGGARRLVLPLAGPTSHTWTGPRGTLVERCPDELYQLLVPYPEPAVARLIEAWYRSRMPVVAAASWTIVAGFPCTLDRYSLGPAGDHALVTCTFP